MPFKSKQSSADLDLARTQPAMPAKTHTPNTAGKLKRFFSRPSLKASASSSSISSTNDAPSLSKSSSTSSSVSTLSDDLPPLPSLPSEYTQALPELRRKDSLQDLLQLVQLAADSFTSPNSPEALPLPLPQTPELAYTSSADSSPASTLSITSSRTLESPGLGLSVDQWSPSSIYSSSARPLASTSRKLPNSASIASKAGPAMGAPDHWKASTRPFRAAKWDSDDSETESEESDDGLKRKQCVLLALREVDIIGWFQLLHLRYVKARENFLLPCRSSREAPRQTVDCPRLAHQALH